MPEAGRYEKLPRPEHQRFLVDRLGSKPTISSIERTDDHHFTVQRYGKLPIQIYLTNKYILSLADTIEILTESPDTTCIVSTMTYNHYSPEAKQHCLERGVGLFKTNELFGAVYFDGDRFLNYVPPER